MEHIIFVEGNIISRSGHHVMKEWLAIAGEDYKSRADEVINGDLILEKDFSTLPYCTFAARGDICCTNSNIEILDSPELIVSNFREEVSKNKELAKIDVPQHLMRNHLNNVYTGVFSEFDVFLTEIFATLVLGVKEYYERYIANSNNINLEDNDCHKKVFKSLHGFFSLNMQNRKEEFQNMFNIVFPDTSKIGRHIQLRHDLAHRSGMKIMGTHLEQIDLSLDGLDLLILDLDVFINNLMTSLEGPISKWKNY